jgi:hypothetical protein
MKTSSTPSGSAAQSAIGTSGMWRFALSIIRTAQVRAGAPNATQ